MAVPCFFSGNHSFIQFSHSPETWHWSPVSTVSCRCSWKLHPWSSAGCTLQNLAWCSLPQSLLFRMTFKYYKKSKTLCSQGFATSNFQHQHYVWARKHSETLFLFNGRVSVYVCLSSIWGSGATNYKKIWKIIKNDGHVLPKLIQKFFIFFQALILTFSQCRLRLMSKPWTKCTIWWSTLEACELCGFQRPPCLEYLGTIIQIKWSSIKHRPRMSLQVCMNIH